MDAQLHQTWIQCPNFEKCRSIHKFVSLLWTFPKILALWGSNFNLDAETKENQERLKRMHRFLSFRVASACDAT